MNALSWSWLLFWRAGMRVSLIRNGCTMHLRRAFRHTVDSSVDCMLDIRAYDNFLLLNNLFSCH